jgi:hypothetical protein
MYFFDGLESGFIEFGIYLLIVIVATLLVFYIIWYLNRKLNKTSRIAVKVASGGKLNGRSDEIPLLTERVKSQNTTKHDKEANKLYEKELKLPSDEAEPEAKREREQEDRKLVGQSEGNTSVVPNNPESRRRETPEEIKEAIPEQISNNPNSDITLPALPAVDNLGETDVELKGKTAAEDLMDVFQVEEEEESNLADLASTMFDVDLKSLGDLGAEVLQFLGVENPTNVKEESSYDEESIDEGSMVEKEEADKFIFEDEEAVL